MIILKDIPGITQKELLHLIADTTPIGEIQTGHGGYVVDERTAHEFLSRYIEALDGIETNTPTTDTPTPARRGRPPKIR
jgi:hypothetical protein